MPREQDITTKYKLDISEFKKNIAVANQSIKESTAEFKKATAGMENWQKSTDGLQAKIKQLKNILESQTNKLATYKKQLDAIQNAEQENSKRAELLKKKMQELSEQGISKTSDEYKKYKNALTAVEKEQEANRKASDALRITITNQEAAINSTNRDIAKYENALNGLEKEQAEAKTSTSKLTQEIEKQQSKLDDLKRKYQNVALEQGKGSKEAKQLAKEIDKLSGELAENKTKLDNASHSAEKLDKSLDVDTKRATEGFTVLKGALASLVADGIRKAIQGIKALAETGIEYESAFTDVKKTVDGTDEQLANLNKDIREMSKSMPQSASDIAEVAAAAGQLGIKTDDISDFTKTMIMLGDSTNLSSEEASTALAKFANVTRMSAKNYSKLGSVIVALGNNFSTTEADIVNMGTNLASAGSQVGMTESQIMAFATALSSVGMEAEAGGTAFSKLMINMQVATETGGEKLKEFAKVAGMSSNEFKKKFKEDAAGAIQEFIKGLANAEGQGKSAIGILDDMGITETRLRDSILRAVGAKDMFNDALETGKKAWEEDVALQNEASKRYETTASKIQIMKNNFKDLGITMFENVQPMIQELLNDLIALANNEEGAIDKIVTSISGMATKLVSKIQSMLPTVVEGIKELVNSFVKALPDLLNSLKEIAPELVNAGIELIENIIDGMGDALPLVIEYVADMIDKVITALIKGIPKLIKAAVKFFQSIIDALPTIIDTLVKNIGSIVDTVVNGLMQAIPDLLQGAIQLFKAIVDAIPKILPALISAIPSITYSIVSGLIENLPAVLDAAIQLFMAIIDAIPVIIENLIPAIPQIVMAVVNVLIENFPVLLKGAVQLFMALVKAIPQIALALLKNIPLLVVAVFKGLADLPPQLETFFTNVWAGIKSIFADVKDWFGNKFQEARQKINEKFNDIGVYFKGKWNAITNAFGNVSSWFRDRFQEAYNNITRIFSGLSVFFGNLWGSIKDRFSSLGTKIGDSISGAVRSGINGLMSRVGNIVNRFINTLNGAIGMINEIPGVSVGKISSISVPHLERGTVLKKGQVGLLEGKGAEAVVPLERNKYWIREVANSLKNQLFDIKSDSQLEKMISSLKNGSMAKEVASTNLVLNIYPQSLTESELDNALMYFNKRLRGSISIGKEH